MTPGATRILWTCWLLAALLGGALEGPPAAAQTDDEDHTVTGARFQVFAGSELESYLRTLQNVGRARGRPWGVRALSAREVSGLEVPEAGHPWAGRYEFGGADDDLEYGVVPPRLRLVGNSAFPFGGNDGPLWAGRGPTGAVELGAYVRYGPVTLVLRPTAFQARNWDFELAPVPGGDDRRYRTPLSPRNADLPQRFGSGPYGRLDPGESTVRVDAGGMAVGLSSAAQQWGGSSRRPLVLGPNAGGVPHVFVGTGRPLDLWLLRVHGRYVAGRLEQSDYSPDREHLPSRRLMTGWAVTLVPRGLPGLELGATRFLHQPWREGSPSADQLLFPFRMSFKEDDPVYDDREVNQLASLFFRWNLPDAGLEVFGEFVRVDHAHNLRVLLLEPDDLAGGALGVRRVWEGEDHLTAFRAEAFRAVSTHRERMGARTHHADRARPMYQHSTMVQGHTHRGQLLASPGGHGGKGMLLGVDRYLSDGLWRVEAERRLKRDRTVGDAGDDPADVDVRYAVGGERTWFVGPLDLSLAVRGVYNLNRYLRGDTFNANLRLNVRWLCC